MPPLNPIIPGFNPDPSICCVGKDFFVATSTFEFFPGVPIYHSTDLINWRLIGHALNRPSQLTMRAVPFSGGIWAPTLRYHKGRFYMITVSMHGRGSAEYSPRPFYVHTDNIWDESSWSEPTYTQVHGIDPDLFFDDDDRVYLCNAPKCRPHHNITSLPTPHLITMGSEIDIKTGRSLSPPVLLRISDVGRRIAEGPHIYKKDGWYYLVTAEGGTEALHRVVISRSKAPLGPYELPPSGVNPLVFNGQDPNIQHTGHADFAQGADGRWWAVMLGVRPQTSGLTPLRRETFLAPVTWEQGGWPIVNKGKPISTVIQADLPSTAPAERFFDDFVESQLQSGWYTVRTPVGGEYSLAERPSHLTLHGGGFTIRDAESPSILLRKQTTLAGRWRTVIDFTPETAYEEAGTVLYISGHSHAALGLRGSQSAGREVVARWPKEDGTFEETSIPVRSDGPIELEIEATKAEITFIFKADHEQEAKEIARCPLECLHPHSELRVFTGPHFGVYAQSNNEPCRGPAHFDWVEYIPM